jgi:hypothetical protein
MHRSTIRLADLTGTVARRAIDLQEGRWTGEVIERSGYFAGTAAVRARNRLWFLVTRVHGDHSGLIREEEIKSEIMLNLRGGPAQ